MKRILHTLKTRTSRTIFLALLLSVISSNLMADVPEEQVKEVNHLINFVKTSDCLLNRNGTEHPPAKSAAHIEKKYNYFRNKIKNTEDFIKYSSTKSTMSGKYYTVTCPGQDPIKTSDWLLEELKLFRANNSVKASSQQ